MHRVTLYFRKGKKSMHKLDFYNVIHHVVSLSKEDAYTLICHVTYTDENGNLRNEVHSCVEVECINLEEIKGGGKS